MGSTGVEGLLPPTCRRDARYCRGDVRIGIGHEDPAAEDDCGRKHKMHQLNGSGATQARASQGPLSQKKWSKMLESQKDS